MDIFNSASCQLSKRFALIAGCCFAWFALSDTADAQKISAEQLKFFESKIRPVLIRECYSCHSDQAGQEKGGLLLDTKFRMEIGGDSGPAIVPGDLDGSLLWNAINHEDYVMPPRKKLADQEIADFKNWIEMGAPDPRQSKVEKIKSTVTENDIKEGRKFWSFVRPKTQPVPEVEDSGWVKNDIDNFVAEKLKSEGIDPVEDADPNALLRRLTIDLTGLPPNPEQVEWFVRKYYEDSDLAISRVVDRLLESERFGERWGRHWLDVARFAESTGREVNATFPNAWRYRDYVIDAFNNDKPYDEFIQEQIAGDLLPAKTDELWAEHLVATGFLAVGPKSLAEQNARQFNLDLVDEQIDVSTRVVLGVSVACARCHDHKFDPIPQQDYYAMAGIFESTSTHYGTIDTAQNRRPSNLLIMPVAKPGPAARKLTSEQVGALETSLSELKETVADLQRQQREARRKGSDGASQVRNFANLTRTVTRIAAIENQLHSVDKDGNPLSMCMGVQDKDKPENARLLVRGEYDQPTETIQRGFVQVISKKQPRIKSNSSGRLELAKWMTDKKNPLTARVMVNRIWQHMFGAGIVRSPENFGATGLQPTHPELLDFLALEFMSKDWSVKNIIRLIANSKTYRMSSQFEPYSYEKDPENNFHWRANPRQLDAESLRDAMLYASGSIDINRPVGSVVAEAGSTLVRDGRIASFQFGVGDDDSIMSRRRRSDRARNVKVYEIDGYEQFRSVFLPIVRDNLPRALEVFDFAEPGMVVGKRETSNTPSQGLYLLNNDFVLKQSRKMAERLVDEAESTLDRIKLAFLLAYGRHASEQEIAAAEKFYRDFETRRSFRSRNDSVELRKLSAIAHSILISAEFRYTN